MTRSVKLNAESGEFRIAPGKQRHRPGRPGGYKAAHVDTAGIWYLAPDVGSLDESGARLSEPNDFR